MHVVDSKSLSRSIHRDEKALLGMPFRLLIALVSIALVVPAVMSGWSSVDYVQTDQRVRSEIARVLTAAQRYLQAGSGGVFGDSAGHAYSRFVRYKLSGGDEQLVTVRNPSVPISSTDGGGLTLFEGSYPMHVECVSGIDVVVWAG
jgi:hypothetical protein